MREAEIEGDVGDRGLGHCLREPRVEIGKTDVEQHLRDRQAKMPAEAELKRANADAGATCELDEIKRLTGIGREAIPRGAQGARQPLSPSGESPDRIGQAVPLAVEEMIEQRLAPIGNRD